MHHLRVRSVLALLCSVAFTTQLSAQATTDSTARARASDEAVLLDVPLVFGASRFDQLATEAPASVTVITAEDIAQRAWRNLSDLLQSVRGFYVINDGVYPTIGARAFGRPGDYNSRLLLVIDGHRINENIFDSFGPGAESMVDLRDVERIEIIRGPSSSLYGTSAFFGVVNVITSRGRTLGGVRARVATESQRTREVALAAGNRFFSRLDVRVSGLMRRSDGRDIFVPEFDTGATRGFARGLDGESRDRATVRLSLDNLTLSGTINHRYKDVATARYLVDFGVPGNTASDRYATLGLGWDRPIGDATRLKLQTSYNSTAYDGQFVIAGDTSTDFARGQWIVSEAQLAHHFPRGHRVLLGTQLTRTPRQEQGVVEEGVRTFSDDTRISSWSLFAQDEVHVGRSWLLSGGLRLDRFSSFGTTVNPRLAVIRSYGSGSAVKLLYGSAFRAPNNYERLYSGVGTVANPTLRPERIRTTEVLVEHRISAQAKISSSVFRNTVSQLIELQPADVEDSWQYRNSGGVTATGVEVEAQTEWHGARATVTQVVQRGRDVVSGSELSNAPRGITTLDVVVPVRTGLSATVELRALTSRTAASGARLPGFALANAAIAWAPPVRGVRATLGVFNLFDRRYADPTNDEFVQASVPQPGRVLRLVLDLGRT